MEEVVEEKELKPYEEKLSNIERKEIIKNDNIIKDVVKRKKIESLIKEVDVILSNDPRFEYIGCVTYGLNKVLIDRLRNKHSGSPATAYVDGRTIYYTFFFAEKLKLKEMIFLTMHEVLHVISNHLVRYENRDPVLANISADHVINYVCKSLENKNLLKIIEGSVLFEDIEQQHPGASFEKVYEILSNEKNIKIEIVLPSDCGKCDDCDGGGGGEGESSEGEGDSNDGSQESDSFGNLPSKIKSKFKDGDNEKRGNYKDISNDDLEEIMKQYSPGEVWVEVTRDGKTYKVPLDTCNTKTNIDKNEESNNEIKNLIRSIWNSSTSKGNIPGEFVTYLDDILEVEIPWDFLLEKALMFTVQSSSKRDWSHKNFYLRHVKVPGHSDKSKNLDTLVVVVDTSGSVGDHDLKKFIGIIVKSQPYFKNIHVVVHDYTIQDIIEVTNPYCEEQVFEKVRGLKGRGGTSHKDVFPHIEEYVQDNKVSTIIFQTDFYSDVESLYRNFTFMRMYETIWVLNSDITINFDGNYDFKQITI